MQTRDIASFFDRAYAASEPLFGSTVRPEFAAWCDQCDPAGMRALDVGCGDGRYSLYLAERGSFVTGVDISEVGLRKLQRIATARNCQIEAVRLDLCTDPLPEGPFDVITVDTVLGHLEPACIQRLLLSFRKVLHPAGIIYVSAFTTEDPGYIACGHHSSELSPTAVQYFKPGELRLLFDGFTELFYQEVLEESRAHGAPHMHGYAVGVFQMPTKG